MNRSKLRIKGVLALLAAALFALAVAPCPASAAPQPYGGNKLSVTSVREGDEVSVYKVVSVLIDSDTRAESYEFTADFGITMAQWEQDAKDAANLQADANKIAQFVHDNADAQAFEKQTRTSTGTGVEFDNLNAGQYLVVVSNRDDATRVFQNTIVSVLPVAQSDGTYKPAEVSADIKFTTLGGSGVTKLIDGKTWEDRIDTSDVARFSITSVIPEYADPSTRTFRFDDTMSDGFVYQGDLKVMAGTTTLKLGTDYAIANESGFFGSITILPGALGTYASQAIAITYSAKLADDDNLPVYSSPESNKVTLTFSPRSVGLNARAEDETQTAESTVYLTVYGLTFKKISTEDGHGLAGAEFSIQTADGVEVATATSDHDGVVMLDGALAAGRQYTLKETKAPAGFELMEDEHFNIKSVQTDDHHGYVYQTPDAKDAPSGFDTLLPVTGGPGTIALTAAGVALIAGAMACVARSRRACE